MAEQQQQELAVREKQELATREERTVPGRFYVPHSDVYETEEALAVVMEVPGVAREAVQIELREDVLRVEARVDPAKYEGLEPVYTEYGVGHWARAFALPDRVDRERIEARLEDGVLTLTLPKAAEARPRRIALA
jgi:HSP20 family molecular chaperone IbpA